MSPKNKEQAKMVVSGLHQWITLLCLPILTILIGDMYHDVKADHEDKIRKDQIIEQHAEKIEKLESKAAYHTGQLNYILARLKVVPTLPPDANN